MIELRRNIKAEKRKKERKALKNANGSDRAPNGALIRRQENVCGEQAYRKIVCRDLNRRDRRRANMQLQQAKHDNSIEVLGRPTVNLISASSRITS